MSEKANINVAIDNIKNIPQIKTDHKVTLDMSSFLFSIGDIKNRKKSPLKAKILLAPLRNILSNPLLNIGKERSILSISATNIKVKRMLNRAIGTIIAFVFIIDFFPIMLATTPINKNKKIIKEIG